MTWPWDPMPHTEIPVPPNNIHNGLISDQLNFQVWKLGWYRCKKYFSMFRFIKWGALLGTVDMIKSIWENNYGWSSIISCITARWCHFVFKKIENKKLILIPWIMRKWDMHLLKKVKWTSRIEKVRSISQSITRQTSTVSNTHEPNN